MVSSTIFFYETDVIKDNRIKEAHSIISTNELKNIKTLNAAQQKWLGTKGGKITKRGGTCTSFGKIGHTQETCFADPKSGAYRPKGASKQRSVNKIQRSSTNAASKFCEKNGHTADTCKQKFHCNHCGKKGHLEATCTANPCSTCNKYYYKSANHRYHNCDGPAAQTKGALNNICQHIEVTQRWKQSKIRNSSAGTKHATPAMSVKETAISLTATVFTSTCRLTTTFLKQAQTKDPTRTTTLEVITDFWGHHGAIPIRPVRVPCLVVSLA